MGTRFNRFPLRPVDRRDATKGHGCKMPFVSLPLRCLQAFGQLLTSSLRLADSLRCSKPPAVDLHPPFRCRSLRSLLSQAPASSSQARCALPSVQTSSRPAFPLLPLDLRSLPGGVGLLPPVQNPLPQQSLSAPSFRCRSLRLLLSQAPARSESSNNWPLYSTARSETNGNCPSGCAVQTLRPQVYRTAAPANRSTDSTLFSLCSRRHRIFKCTRAMRWSWRR